MSGEETAGATARVEVGDLVSAGGGCVLFGTRTGIVGSLGAAAVSHDGKFSFGSAPLHGGEVVARRFLRHSPIFRPIGLGFRPYLRRRCCLVVVRSEVHKWASIACGSSNAESVKELIYIHIGAS